RDWSSDVCSSDLTRALRKSERQMCAGRPADGNVEESTHLGLLLTEERRQRRTEPEGAAGEDQVLDGRIDRCAADHRGTIEARVGDRELGDVDADDDDDGRLVEVLGEVVSRAHHALLPGPGLRG